MKTSTSLNVFSIWPVLRGPVFVHLAHVCYADGYVVVLSFVLPCSSGSYVQTSSSIALKEPVI